MPAAATPGSPARGSRNPSTVRRRRSRGPRAGPVRRVFPLPVGLAGAAYRVPSLTYFPLADMADFGIGAVGTMMCAYFVPFHMTHGPPAFGSVGNASTWLASVPRIITIAGLRIV